MNGHEHNHEHHERDHVHGRRTGGHSRDRSQNQWVPGLVEVQFKRDSESGVIDQSVFDPSERRKPYYGWSEELVNVLKRNQLIAWKPSFPVTYPWSKESVDAAFTFYRNRGRDKFVTFRFSKHANVSRISTQLRHTREIARATPVARVAPPSINEPLLGVGGQVQGIGQFESQWYAFRCNLPQALEQVRGKGVVVAAIDWGFDCYHEEYSYHIDRRRNIYRKNEAIANGTGVHHGTAVMGLAGGRLNGKGIVGFAPESILWGIQAGENNVMDHRHWREAIDFVRLEDPDPTVRKVIILEVQTASEGNIEAVPSINQAISDAVASNIVVCVPAGNGTGNAGSDDQDPPQPIPETGSILVGATCFDAEDNVVCSKSGERIVVYAPGDEHHDVTCSSQPLRYRNSFGGTSGAVAKVAGAVALMLEANSALTPAEVRDILRLSQTPVLRSLEAGAVLLDCESAVKNARQGINQ